MPALRADLRMDKAVSSQPGEFSGASGVSFGLASAPADGGLHRPSRRDLVKDGLLVRSLAENTTEPLSVFARRTAATQNDRHRRLRHINSFVEYLRRDDGFVLSTFKSPKNVFTFVRVRSVRDRRNEEQL